MKFIASKTDDGEAKRKIALYCQVLGVSRQGFYQYLKNRDKAWKYQDLADAMMEILQEDECNDTYGRKRMYEALLLKKPEGIAIPSERTVYRVMKELGISHRPKRKPKGITKADKEARKSDDLLKRDFQADHPLEKAVTDITEIKASDGKLYVSALFDCFNLEVLGLAMADNMKADLCVATIRIACAQHQGLTGARCHDNARCESMWARFKEELLYERYDTTKMTIEELKTLIWRYFMSYWNNRRICSAIGGMPPVEKRRRYEEALDNAA